MTATVEIVTAEHVDVLNVPIQSVVSRTQKELEERAGDEKADDDTTLTRRSDRKEEDEIEGVFIVGDGDKAEFVAVTTGIADDLSIEVVTDELTEGQRVISGPYRVLRTLKIGTDLKVEEKSDSKQTEE